MNAINGSSMLIRFGDSTSTDIVLIFQLGRRIFGAGDDGVV